jgi:hypothetical protein
MGLGYSRLMSVECPVSQTLEHFWACPQHACACFGGLPKTVMGDPLQAAVLQGALGDAPVFHPQELDFATHHGLTIPPCHVGQGHAKGRVEHGVGDVNKNFLTGLEVPDCRALAPPARYWLAPIANVRVHDAPWDKPTALWPTERPSLSPLPLHPFDIATVSQGRAARPFRRPRATNRDAVPAHYAGHASARIDGSGGSSRR